MMLHWRTRTFFPVDPFHRSAKRPQRRLARFCTRCFLQQPPNWTQKMTKRKTLVKDPLLVALPKRTARLMHRGRSTISQSNTVLFPIPIRRGIRRLEVSWSFSCWVPHGVCSCRYFKTHESKDKIWFFIHTCHD